jgi:hypothetical protein
LWRYISLTAQTPATDFTLGQTLCAKVTGAPLGLRTTQVQRRLGIVGPGGYIRSQLDVKRYYFYRDAPVQYSRICYSLSAVTLLDNRGTWQAISISARDGSARAKGSFSLAIVTGIKVSDLSIQSAVTSVGDLSPGENVSFTLLLSNGWNRMHAEEVVVTNPVPANTTLCHQHQVQLLQCVNPSGQSACTLAKGAKVKITLTYLVNSGTSGQDGDP